MHSFFPIFKKNITEIPNVMGMRHVPRILGNTLYSVGGQPISSEGSDRATSHGFESRARDMFFSDIHVDDSMY